MLQAATPILDEWFIIRLINRKPNWKPDSTHTRYMRRSNVAIVSVGLTHSSCELLTSLGVETPFNGPSDDQICYNGNFQHSYLLTYSKQAFQAVGSSAGSRPLFSYLALNVGHDDTGRRIQSLDAALSDYLTHLAQDSHSLTILLADHGNTYTAYTTTLEGRFEMFHPSLFVVVPKHVTKLLGPRAMSALKINQRRLATAVDLHHSLKALAGPLVGGVKAEGVFAEISPNRTCRDVELRTPNLCVCDGWDSPTTNDSSKLALAEFAVGQLNNQMQKRYMARLNTAANNAGTPAAKLPLLRSCQRLQPLRIENVRERNSGIGGYLTTTMDVHVVGATKIGERAEEVFNVEVRSREMNNDTSLHLELVHYERLTQYGHYGACADEGVPPKLCVCSRSRNSSKRKTLDEISWARYASFFGEKYSLTVLPDQKCLAFFRRRHAHGRSVAYEAANICEHERFLISFNAEVENMKVSRDVPFVVEVPPGSVTFLMSARVHVPYWKWTVEEEVEVVSSIKI